MSPVMTPIVTIITFYKLTTLGLSKNSRGFDRYRYLFLSTWNFLAHFAGLIYTQVRLLTIIWKGPNVYLRAGVRRDDIQCGGMRSGYQGIISQPSTGPLWLPGATGGWW